MKHKGAAAIDHGDVAYEVEIYPGDRIHQMILWGDEEFAAVFPDSVQR